MFAFRRTYACAFGASALLACAAFAQEPQRHTLRFSFVKDSVSWHRMSSEIAMKMDMEMFGQKQNIDNHVSIEMTIHSKVVDVLPSGAAKVERTVKRLKTKLVNPMMGESEYDSDVKGSEAGPMADMAVLVGVKMTLEMDQRGQIKSLKFPPELEDKLSGQMSLGDLESMFAKESIVLPEQPVAVGETWKTETQLPLGANMGEVKITTENKLLSFANDLATVEQKIAFGEAQEVASPMGGGTLKVTGQPSEGRIELYLKEGRLEKTATRMKMNMNGPSVNMDIDMDMKLERTEEPKPAPTPGGGEPVKKQGGGD